MGKLGRPERYGNQVIEIELALCDRIRTAVSIGDLPPGTKLPEEAVAEAFSANRSQVRSAFQRLAFEGLVDLHRNRGAFVARLDKKDARDLFEARRVIERGITEVVTRTILTHQLRALERHVRDSRPHWIRGHRPGTISSLSAFHLSLASLAHNAALTTALERLIIRTSLVLGLHATGRTFAALPTAYETLMDLIASGRSLDAARQMEECLFTLEEGLEFQRTPQPEVELSRVLRMLG